MLKVLTKKLLLHLLKFDIIIKVINCFRFVQLFGAVKVTIGVLELLSLLEVLELLKLLGWRYHDHCSFINSKLAITKVIYNRDKIYNLEDCKSWNRKNSLKLSFSINQRYYRIVLLFWSS